MSRDVLKSLLVPLFVAQMFSCSTAKKDAAPSPQDQEGYVEVGNGVRLFYRMMGSGPDTLVVLHGGPGFTMDYFLEDLRPLAAHHVLLFYDQRGAGGSTLVSDSASLDAQRFVDDLEALRKHFSIASLNLLGHSWGTGVAALYAMKYPDHLNTMIIVGALPLEQHQLADAFARLAAGRDSSTLLRMRELQEARVADPANADLCHQYYVLWFEPFYGVPDDPAPSKGDFCAGTAESRRNKINGVDQFTFASLGKWDWRSGLSKVKTPTLVIHGTKDPLPLEGARAWDDVLPNGEILQLEGIGHFPYIEAPEIFFKAVNEFLRAN